MMRVFLGFVFFIVSYGTSAQVIEWGGGNPDFANIGENVSTLEDPDGSFTIDQVRSVPYQARFKPSDKVILNFGFTESVYWIKFNLDNPTNEELVLEIAHAFLPVTDLYYADNDGNMQKIEAGYRIPLYDKIYKHHHQIFPLPQGRHEYYVRLISNAHPLPVRVYTKSAFQVKFINELLMYGFYLGFMCFVILSNLFFFFSLKNRMYLFYAGVVLLYIGYASAVMDGFILYFFPNLDLMFWYINIPTIGVTVQLIYALQFLEARKYTPGLNKYSWWVVWYFAAYIFLKYLLPAPVIYAVNTVHALISFFLMCYLGYKTGKNGNRLGYYFGVAYFIYFLLVLIEATYVQIGTPPYLAGLSHVAFATLIESFILSFLLSRRFEWEKEETEKAKNEAQIQLLEKTQENEQIVKEQNVLLEQRVAERTAELNNSLVALKKTQNQLVQSEKLASLGVLTAGIAHEIQNPLNFVNNYSEVNVELIEEIKEEIDKGSLKEARTIILDMESNEQKILYHGKRADSIVKGMLLHARSNKDVKEEVDINAQADECMRLAYHGLRAKDKEFNAYLEKDFQQQKLIAVVNRQDFGRILLNIFNNAFYALNEKSRREGESYHPTLWLSTKASDNHVEIRIRDNGIGIPQTIRKKIFEPFFTTKPTGHGTGLGLSLAYDVVIAHGGELTVNSTEGNGSEFVLKIPRKNN